MNEIVKIGFPMEYEDDKHIIRTGLWLKEYEVEALKKRLNEYNHLQSKIDKINKIIDRKLSTETYQHLKKLYDDIDSTEEIWEDYEFEDLRDVLKEDK